MRVATLKSSLLLIFAFGLLACEGPAPQAGATPGAEVAVSTAQAQGTVTPSAAPHAGMKMAHGDGAELSPGAAVAVTRVTDASTICMMNDQVMGSGQTPIEVEGRTYYGCCAMCNQRLGSDAKLRHGTDPVTQKAVDKSSAVLAKTADGRVLYFENEANLATYMARSGG